MKFLVVGLGSMGKKRVRNLMQLKAGEVTGFDLRADRRREVTDLYGVKTFARFEQAMSKNPDALIISTSPHAHLPYCFEAIRENKHFFTEVNWPGDLADMDRLIRELRRKKGLIGVPSCTFRFHPSISTIKKVMEEGTIGRAVQVTYTSGQWLPDWHPYEDYRHFYVASKDTGSGREQVSIELDWLRWCFGRVSSVSAMVRKMSTLEIDAFDTYQMLLDFAGGSIASVLVDLVRRDHNRYCLVVSEKGTIIWDWRLRCVRVLDAASGVYREYPERPGYWGYYIEDMYRDEMASFVAAVEGKGKYMNSYAEERKVMDLIVAAEKSSAAQTVVSMK